MRFPMTILFLLVALYILHGQPKSTSFGTINVQIDSNEVRLFNIKTSILYENADVDFDTTVQIQDAEENEVLYYAQITNGTNNVIRFIIELPETEQDNFYDVIFNLGDSLKNQVVYENAESKVFFDHEGRLNNFKPYTKNLNGRFLFLKHTGKQNYSGELNTTFDLPLSASSNQYSTISMKGTFDVYSGEFKSVSLSTAPPIQSKKQKYVKNVAIAVIITAIGLFLILGR